MTKEGSSPIHKNPGSKSKTSRTHVGDRIVSSKLLPSSRVIRVCEHGLSFFFQGGALSSADAMAVGRESVAVATVGVMGSREQPCTNSRTTAKFASLRGSRCNDGAIVDLELSSCWMYTSSWSDVLCTSIKYDSSFGYKGGGEIQ